MAGHCIFCGVKFGTKGPESRSSAEHFWSRKLAKSLKAPANIRGSKKHAETHISESGAIEVLPNPVFVQKGHWLYQTIPDAICKSCNSSWLSSLQGPAVDSILRLRSDILSARARVDYPAIAKWIYSRFLLHLSTYPAESIVKGDAGGFLSEINSQRDKENRRFFIEKAPPLTSAIYYAPISFVPPLVTATNLLTMFYPESGVPREAFFAHYVVENVSLVIFSNSGFSGRFDEAPFRYKRCWPVDNFTRAPRFSTPAKEVEDLLVSSYEEARVRMSLGRLDASAAIFPPIRRNFS